MNRSSPHETDDALTDLDRLVEPAIELAATLLDQANSQLTRDERQQAESLARLMRDPLGKDFTIALTDQVFRARSATRAADQLRYLIGQLGVPEFLTGFEKILLRAGEWASTLAPNLVLPRITDQLRNQSSRVILPGEDPLLNPHLAERRNANFRMNLNQLGEAILGEEEAERRLQAILSRLKNPSVDYVSVKISAIYSRINLLAWEETVSGIQQRLRALYRAALANLTSSGRRPKFVNLDMEEYRDLELTLVAFQRTLDEVEFHGLSAGIVLQAYLPDSHDAQRRLTAWAKARVDAGGAPIKLRIVKGANLAMERVEAELQGWPQAPYQSKPEVDASFKAMVEYALRPDHLKAVRIGVASHNLFDVAFTLLLAKDRGVLISGIPNRLISPSPDSLIHENQASANGQIESPFPVVEWEMLEGMANHQARAVRDAAHGLLLYAPVVNREDFHSAMAYLVRRLDENTAKENFLHDLFGLRKGSPAWSRQSDAFRSACRCSATVSSLPRRTQDRSVRIAVDGSIQPFANEPNTDWVLVKNRTWIAQLRERWKTEGAPEREIPLVLGQQTIRRKLEGVGRDSSKPNEIAYRYEWATTDDVQRALDVAVQAVGAWWDSGVAARAQILHRAAAVMANHRGASLACMILDAGKTLSEGDAEVSEAIDFARYYAESAMGWLNDGQLHAKPVGVVVIAPPWNFPYAIPAGGVLAALAMGNSVVLKPANETVLTAWLLANQLWQAGVPREVLQFLPCPDNEVGQKLITDDRVGAVVLTGAWTTARMFLRWKPLLNLFAETSGKNAMVISALADRDQAIKDLVHSAFNHAGQKCSAASLAILEAEVYDDPRFLAQLRDATQSLVVGSAWDPATQIPTLIREPGNELQRGLTQLEPGESWLLQPKMLDGNPCLWTPGIRLGVKPGSWYQRTECFGPVLGLIRAVDFRQAVAIQNQSEFGLTGGLQSLDEREIAYWKDHVEVGNAYINRGTTGAIVRRQPFGGWKKSCVGFGAKAGGPNYVAQFANWADRDDASHPTVKSVENLSAHYRRAFEKWFRDPVDPSMLEAEANNLRYRPYRGVFLRLNTIEKKDLAFLQAACHASAWTGSPIHLSVDNQPLEIVDQIVAEFKKMQHRACMKNLDIVFESELEAAERLPSVQVDVLRTFGMPEAALLNAANESGLRRIHSPPSRHARLELTRWLKEQSVTETRHRYGNPLPRRSE